jgi:2,3,4,5-tetrahydropyridine-2,6-dicarboxylate N-succinyltransferase
MDSKQIAEYQALVAQHFQTIKDLTPESCPKSLAQALQVIISALDQGHVRVATPSADGWHVHVWLKQAILLFFRTQPMQVFASGAFKFYDKVPLKYTDYTAKHFQEQGARVVPQAVVRRGAYVGKNVVLMPSYINIGAYVGQDSMIDTWATIGSCAQIGARVHVSGGAGIGGVLEPLQARPTIIEDHCFIGARSEIVEGAVIGQGSVIGMGTFIGGNTKILDAQTGEVYRGYVPAGSVVVPGSMPARSGGTHHLACAVIIKKVDLQTKQKTSLNDLLRQDNE